MSNPPPFIKGQEPGEPISARMLNLIIDRLQGDGLLPQTADMSRQIELVELDADLLPNDRQTFDDGQVDGNVQVVDHDAAALDDKYVDVGTVIGQTYDAQGQVRLTGERIAVMLLPNAPAMVPVCDRIYVGTLDEDLDAGDSAEFNIFRSDDAGTFTDSGENLTVFDFLLPPGGEILQGERVLVGQMPESRIHVVIGSLSSVSPQRGDEVFALTADLECTSATATANIISCIDRQNVLTTGVTLCNVPDFTAAIGGKAYRFCGKVGYIGSCATDADGNRFIQDIICDAEAPYAESQSTDIGSYDAVFESVSG